MRFDRESEEEVQFSRGDFFAHQKYLKRHRCYKYE